jgi:hypothetical protein
MIVKKLYTIVNGVYCITDKVRVMVDNEGCILAYDNGGKEIEVPDYVPAIVDFRYYRFLGSIGISFSFGKEGELIDRRNEVLDENCAVFYQDSEYKVNPKDKSFGFKGVLGEEFKVVPYDTKVREINCSNADLDYVNNRRKEIEHIHTIYKVGTLYKVENYTFLITEADSEKWSAGKKGEGGYIIMKNVFEEDIGNLGNIVKEVLKGKRDYLMNHGEQL